MHKKTQRQTNAEIKKERKWEVEKEKVKWVNNKKEKRERDKPSVVGLQGESDREASEGEEASDGRNKERQINTCPQTCKHTVRKGIRLIKCASWVNGAKRDMPKR